MYCWCKKKLWADVGLVLWQLFHRGCSRNRKSLPLHGDACIANIRVMGYDCCLLESIQIAYQLAGGGSHVLVYYADRHIGGQTGIH